MISNDKKAALLADLKNYKKNYLQEKYLQSDESSTRLMINHLLTSILGYKPLDEVKTEYMIKGTYADYVIQLDGDRPFLVEVKAMQFELSDKHLRQAVNYAANEGIEWILLTNGKDFQLYKVIFGQPIDSKLVFDLRLMEDDLKTACEFFQYLTRAAVLKNGLAYLWNRFSALSPHSLASFLYSSKIIAILKKELKEKYETTFDEEDIINALTNVIEEKVEGVKPMKEKKKVEKPRVKEEIQGTEADLIKENPNQETMQG
jgi:hypothetical protein